jgi:hypothetical protein
MTYQLCISIAKSECNEVHAETLTGSKRNSSFRYLKKDDIIPFVASHVILGSEWIPS